LVNIIDNPIKKKKKKMDCSLETKESEEFLKGKEWTTQFFVPKEYEFDNPEIKYCKKKKEFFTVELSKVWYKSPYKYNMKINGRNLEKNLFSSINLIYEDGTTVSEETVSKTEINFSQKGENVSQVNFPTFHFNICSYKHEGKKFRIVVNIYHKKEEIICRLVSFPILIKAKKPISKPGIKGLKRKYEENINTNKKIQIPRNYNPNIFSVNKNFQINNYSDFSLYDPKFLYEKYNFNVSKCQQIVNNFVKYFLQ
jgi:hypothetical protein